MDFNDAFKAISELVNDFKANENHYLNPSYSEADVRNDFINKFFIALGWDVRHESQKNPYEQEVRVEKAVQIAKAQKRADYSFSIAPNFRTVKFFVEAKKPSHGLANKDYYFQTARYGWNASTPIAALTDFEEFHIIDCRFRPDINDALNYKISQFHYSDYADKEKFSEIYWLFSREAVIDNSIEKYVDALPKPRGKKAKGLKAAVQSIDESFLEELDEIRNDLAKSFKKNNTHLSSEELTEATQRTIDRLVFIKFLEDKLIEPDHYVSEFGGRRKAWEDFLIDSRKLDAKYNGVVFKKSIIDSKSTIEPDDKTFSAICEELSHENTPYNFDAIPIHILGSIYERFLGKVVNATDKRVTIEEKPEVRKAGGVYYTPQYIVNYIVDNTVGKLIDGKTPKEIAKMRFADIACGSGSFLITVFERLLDYHKRWYIENPEQAKKDGCILVEGVYHLSLKQKTKILLNNVYGVDIDQQAVEVTQLSLYLKLLEDETTATANDTWVLFKEQLLPDLNKNIVCGNSLIGTDILNPTSFLPFSKGEDEGGVGRINELKLKPMDFETVFPEVTKSGGFDAIVGNPPWGVSFSEVELNYLRNKFNEIIVRMIDSFMYFTKQSLSLLKSTGRFGYILPDVLLYQTDNEKLREYLLQNYSIEQILNLGDVFDKVIRPSCIIISNSTKSNDSTKVLDLTDIKKKDKSYKTLVESKAFEVVQAFFSTLPSHNFVTRNIDNFKILEKINKSSVHELSDFIDEDGIQRGVSPDLKKAFIVDSKTIKNENLEKDILKPVLTGGVHLKRYLIEKDDLWLIYSNRKTDIKKYPNIRNFIDRNKNEITCVEVKQKKHSIYSLHRAREENIFLKAQKIIGVITEDEIVATIDEERNYYTDGLYLFAVKKDIDARYILGIINSSLFVFLYRTICMESGRVLAQVKPTILERLPIRVIDSNNKIEYDIYQKMISLVDQILTAKKLLQQAKTESDKSYLERKCETLDKQIDEIVFQLYGLTEEEKKIVEGEIK
jgi:adenine-specific DNA-methyltransferase